MKNFDEIYKILSHISTEKFEIVRKRLLKKLIIGIPIAIIFVIIGTYILPGFVFFFIVISIMLLSAFTHDNSFDTYTYYKNEIIAKLVSAYDNNLKFDLDSRIQMSDYLTAEFELFDKFYSNDLIYGKIDGIIDLKLGDVCTEDESTNSDGKTSRTTLFKGLFSVIQLNKNTNSTIKIRIDKFFKGSKKNLLAMDSQEFEKYFDVYSTDKVLAMRILTSDIMDYMLTFTKENKIKFEITIKNSQVFIRIHCKDMFEPPTLKEALDYETLHKYYKYINFMCELNTKIYNVISSKDI